MAIHKLGILKKVGISTNSFAFYAEILVQLLKKGYSYIEVPIKINESKDVITSIFKFKPKVKKRYSR